MFPDFHFEPYEMFNYGSTLYNEITTVKRPNSTIQWVDKYGEICSGWEGGAMDGRFQCWRLYVNVFFVKLNK